MPLHSGALTSGRFCCQLPVRPAPFTLSARAHLANKLAPGCGHVQLRQIGVPPDLFMLPAVQHEYYPRTVFMPHVSAYTTDRELLQLPLAIWPYRKALTELCCCSSGAVAVAPAGRSLVLCAQKEKDPKGKAAESANFVKGNVAQILGIRGGDKESNIWKIRLQLTKPVTWIPLIWGEHAHLHMLHCEVL